MSTQTTAQRPNDRFATATRTSAPYEPAESTRKYIPWERNAPRSSQRIAMHARHEQDRRQRGW